MSTIGIDRAASIQQIRSELQIGYSHLPMLGALWDAYEAKDFYAGLRYQYTRRAALDWLRGNNWDAIEWEQADVKEKGDDLFANLETLFTDTVKEIARLETQANSSRGPILGRMSPCISGYPEPCPPWRR